MRMLPDYARAHVLEMVDARGLQWHWRVPVRMMAEWDGWVVQWGDQLDPAVSFAVRVPGLRVMVVSMTAPLLDQRVAIAHHMAHAILGHDYGLDIYGIGRGPDDDAADLLAAFILLPRAGISVAEDVETVARRCEVPVWMVEQRAAEIRERTLVNEVREWHGDSM